VSWQRKCGAFKRRIIENSRPSPDLVHVIDVKIIFLARLEGGSCIWNTATTDNAVQKHYLNVDRQLLPGSSLILRKPWLEGREIAAEIAAVGNGIFVAA
jgi:hypothetical protein